MCPNLYDIFAENVYVDRGFVLCYVRLAKVFVLAFA